MSVIENHDVSTPLFLFYAAHLVHLPYEVPQAYLDHMSVAGGGPFDNVANLINKSADSGPKPDCAEGNGAEDGIDTTAGASAWRSLNK